MSINTPGNSNKFIEEMKEELNTSKTIEELKIILNKTQSENLKGNINDDAQDEINQLVLVRALDLDINIDEFINQGKNFSEFEELTDIFSPVEELSEVNPLEESSEVNPFEESAENDAFSSGIELPKINLESEVNKSDDFMDDHTTFFEGANSDDLEYSEENSFEEDVNDESTVQEDVNVKDNTPEKARSSIRNSLLAVAGLVAVAGFGLYNANNNFRSNHIQQNTNSIQENTLADGSVVELDSGTQEQVLYVDETVDAEVADETVDAEVPDETVDAEVADETVDAEVVDETVDAGVPDETVDAEVADETVDAEVVDETVDAGVPDETVDAGATNKTIKIPFLKEESIQINFVPKTTIYGDIMIDFDASIIEWENDGWEALEAFYHSPTKSGWILKKEEQIVFILQQIVEKGENNVLAYVQPKTW